MWIIAEDGFSTLGLVAGYSPAVASIGWIGFEVFYKLNGIFSFEIKRVSRCRRIK
jgi:hypothetical protein